MAARGCRPVGAGTACSSVRRARSNLAQGYPAGGLPGLGLRLSRLLRLLRRSGVLPALMLGLALASAPGGAAAAEGPCEPLPLQALAPGLWLVPAPSVDGDEANRGQGSHLLLARDGARLWAVGSGPTPAFGRRLRCTAQRRLGQAPTDLLVPWARAELALGGQGLAAQRSWAHAQVAAAMAEQCAHCVDRLRQRLGAAAADLGDDPVSLPRRLLHGPSGRLGPFDWWVLPRAPDRVVTVLRHRASGVMSAHGLLWGDGPPDARDADLALLRQALQQLARLAPAATRWVGEGGPLLDAAGVAAQAGYLQALDAAVRPAVAAGDLGQQAPVLPGHAADSAHARHALNWQRAWRQAEDDWLRGPR